MVKDGLKKLRFTVRSKQILGEPRFIAVNLKLFLCLKTHSKWKDYPTELFERELIQALRYTDNEIHYIMTDYTVQIMYTL